MINDIKLSAVDLQLVFGWKGWENIYQKKNIFFCIICNSRLKTKN